MAKNHKSEPSIADMSAEELDLAIKQSAFQRETLELDRVRDDNSRRLEEKAARSLRNRQRQAELQAGARSLAVIQSKCRHRQGGRHQDILRGTGKPCIARTMMLDGFTYLLQCLRCRLKVFTPNPALKHRDPEEYEKQKEIYDKLFELSEDSGLDEIRGPSWIFSKNGVPFIPERV